MKVIIFSAKNYNDEETNFGDCIVIDSGSSLVVYDCGHQKHAERVLAYMQKEGYKKADFILSHNDSDHFDGLPYLIEAGVISKVYTLLLLEYKKELLKLIDDGRITDESLTRRISDKYDNIYSLSGKVELVDALTLPTVRMGIELVGPEKNAALAAVAKFLDNREGDTIDGETIYNAICFQAKITMDSGQHMLLCGDSAFSMIEPNLEYVSYIQLPHHGKYEIAEKIFEFKDKSKRIGTKYYVSDNTGTTNGGSDTLKTKDYGRDVSYTTNGDISVEVKRSSPYVTGKSYGSIIDDLLSI